MASWVEHSTSTAVEGCLLPSPCCGTFNSPTYRPPRASGPADRRKAAVTTSSDQDTLPRLPETEGVAGGNLDKVRDLLFGGQMRDYDRKFARLEERLVKETAD